MKARKVAMALPGQVAIFWMWERSPVGGKSAAGDQKRCAACTVKARERTHLHVIVAVRPLLGEG
jgi:hypothetical protein